MKTLRSIGLIMAASIAMLARAGNQAPVTRYPAISSVMYANILYWNDVSGSQDFPEDIHLLEGETTSTNNLSTQYFAVAITSLKDGGTILSIPPLQVDDSGVLNTSITVRDVLSRTNCTVSLVRDATNNVVTGAFSIAGQQFSIYIFYPAGVGVHPSMKLTWGTGSGPDDPGLIADDMSNAVVGAPKPLDTRVSMDKPIGLQGISGRVYICITTTNENVVVQSSSDLKKWSDDPNPPISIFGYRQYHSFALANASFFRSRTTK